MDINRIARTGSLLAAVAATPAISMGAGTPACVSSPVTASSYTWDFHKEAANLLRDIRDDAQKAQNRADRLAQNFWDPNIDWHGYNAQLTPLRAEVDDIGAKLCRLEVIRPAELPWEQRATDQAASYAKKMAWNTQQAILFVNYHQDDLQNPILEQYSMHVFSESQDLSRMIHKDENLARVSYQEHQPHGEPRVASRS